MLGANEVNVRTQSAGPIYDKQYTLNWKKLCRVQKVKSSKLSQKGVLGRWYSSHLESVCRKTQTWEVTKWLVRQLESISRAAIFNMHTTSPINHLPRMPLSLSFDESTFTQHDNDFQLGIEQVYECETDRAVLWPCQCSVLYKNIRQSCRNCAVTVWCRFHSHTKFAL